MPGGGPGSPTGTAALSELLSAFVGGSAITSTHNGITTSDVSGIGSNSTSIQSFLENNNEGSSTARAFVNYLLFDEQMKFYNQGGADPVQSNGGYKNHTYFINNPVSVPKSGYIYVFVSNESNLPVYFDNLAVTHTPGAILEENHYYPFGLLMQGISSQALSAKESKKKFQGQELAHKEFSDGSGLEMYEFKYRMDDPQTGRFWQVDPLAEKYVYNSTYAFSENKVTAHVELEGLEAAWADGNVERDLRDYSSGKVNNAGLESRFQTRAYVSQFGTTKVLLPVATVALTAVDPPAGIALFLAQKGMPAPIVPAPTSVASSAISEGASLESGAISLEQRAQQIHAAQDAFGQSKSTTAVGTGVTQAGEEVTMVASSRANLTSKQRAVLNNNETPIGNKDIGLKSNVNVHAEQKITQYATKNNIQVQQVAASRPICQNCAGAISSAGAQAASQLKKVNQQFVQQATIGKF